MRSQTPTPRSVRFVSTFAVLAALLAALVFSSSALAQSPPGSVSAVSLSRADGTVTADWPAVAGAARYHVTYSTDGGASWHAPVDDHWNVPTNGLTFGADNAKTYVVGVRAGNDDGWGGWTNSSSAGPYTTPAISATLTIADAKADEGDALSFTVTLDNAVPGGFTVTPSFTDGTATGGTDYTATASALTFTGTAGETQTVTVQTTEDTDTEDDETFTVGLSVSNTAHDVTASGTGTGTITNDDSAAVTVNDAKADEGDGITFTVTLGEAVQGGLKVTPGYTNGTAASTDYTANTTALTFTGNANETKSFTVSTTEDAVLEANETFTVGLSVSGTTHDVTASGTGTGTITNDDSAAVTVNDAKADEGDDITFTVTLSEAVQGGLKVTPSFTDGTAVEGTDYDDNTTALSFSGTKGETKTFTVSTTEDEDVEGDETFTVGLTVSGTTHDVTDSDTATGTITNDDSAAASITLSVNPSSVSEDAGSTSVTVTATADAAVAANTPVTVSIGGGTATSGTDYTAAASLELEIPAGGTTGTGAFKLTPIYDSEIEGKETIPVSGSASGLSVTGTSLELTDSKDVSAEWWFGARLSVSPGSVSENGGKRKVTVTAEVSEWGTSTDDLSYEVTVGKGGDSAVSGTDYKAVSKFNVVIKANRRSGSNSFNLEPIGDTDWEGNETITIHASGTDGAQSTTLTLTDEGDRPYNGPPITLSANPSKVSEADGATTVTVTATLPSAAVANSQATVSVGGGTATPGTDYAAVSDVTITIAKNATTATGTFTLTPTQDTLAEGDETITIAGPAGVSTPATLTLTDDDAAPAVTLSASPSSVTENGGAKTVTVTATSAAATAKARTVLVAVGNRQDTATPGTDYTVVPAFNITIAANATTATGTFSLTPTNDTSVEDAESISIDGTPESAGATFTVGGTAITLTDDDAMPAVTLTATPSSVDEAALATSVTVKATAASAVAWARTLTVSVGKTGSAASGTDYAAVSNFDITIAANALSGTGAFTLKPIQDTTNEGDETIGVAGSSLNTTVTGATVTLADDDVNPAVTLSVSPASVGESASATSVTVTATAASAMSSARTVSVKVGDSGTATSGTDYAAVSDFTITIAANATSGTGTFTLTPTQDTQSEGGETIGVSGSSTATTVTGTTVALTDDDTLPAVTLSVSTSSVSEGASATSVTVTATAASSVGEARTVTVSVGQTGTASPGSDYAAVTDFDITIAANATSGTGTFTLTPTQDTVVEYNETIGVDGSSPNTVMTNATITLTDDDKDSVTLSLNRRTLGEEASGTSVTVTATAATAIAVARTVTVSVGGSGTATSGTDYTAVSDFTITIAANATSGTGSFTLTPTQDTTNEGNETIGVAGTNSLSTVTGTTLTLVDDDQPTISLTSGTAAFSESWSGTIDITATRTGSTTSAVDVTIIVGRDTDSATEGVDYTEVADYTITIPAGQTSASKGFSVAGKRDFVADNNERFSIGGLATGYKVNDVSNGVGIFEWYATIGLTTDVSSVSEHDGATTVTVTAHIHPTVYGNVYVTVSVGGGTATSGTDYAAVSNFTITIPNKASSATGTFTLTPTPDALLESDETININGSGSHFNFYAGQGTSMTLTDAQPISLSAHPSRVSEGAPGTQVAVSATATGTLPTPRTVTVSVGDTGTATSGTDYAAVSDFDIVIPANKRGATNTFTLTPTKDSAAEGDETIGVAGSSTGAYVYPTTLTLADTNPAVTLTAAPSTISEGASATSVTVTATAASAIATARTVTVAVGDTGTATSGTDYAAVSDFTITIAANATSGTGSFTLTPTDDTALEGDETIGVAGTSSEAATISGTSLTLTDDDLPTITLATVPPDVKIAEGAGLTSVTVRATAAAAMKAETTVTLSVGAGGDSATKTTDYTTSNVRTITIPKGQSMAEASFELTPVQDTSVEGDETVSISGSSSGGHTVTGTSLKLTDDDKHVIALSASPSSVGEGASATSVTVTATAKAATSSARTVRVQVGDSGTATSGTDYAAVSDFTITIAANAKTGTGTFTLTPTQDTSVEGNETIGVEGASPNSTVTGTTMTLTDDDSYPAITLSANPSSVSEGASATSVTVTATAASAIASARTVTVSVGGSGTASRGIDYATVADFTVTIAANATSGTGTFTLTPSQDTLVEGSETIGVAGSSPSSTVTGSTVTLTDDDTHAITLSASPSSVSESKASETVTVTATINVARSAATTVTVSVGESGDQATSGTDYEAVSDFTVTIAANATSGTGTFTFKPKTDTAYEGFENVTISGTTAQLRDKDEDQNQDVVGTQSETGVSTSIPVTDTSLSIHDSSNYPAVTLTAAPSSVGEGAGATSVTVTATAASAIGSSREVTVSVGGSGTATSGTDYTAVSDFIIKIAANATSGTGTFTLTPTDDSVVEASETIGVAGTSLSTTVTGTTVTLTDNDDAEVTINDASAAEGSDMTFTVTLDTAVDGGLTVTPDFTDVTATEGTDYDENTAALSFTGTAGETQTFTVSTTQDDVVEGNETFTVGLSVSNAPTGVTVTATDTGTGTIESGSGGNVDTATLTINDASASEGDGITFTVTLSEAVQGGLTVTPDFTDVTATEGTDYDENTTALTFTGTKGETQTFTVDATEDAVLEANETFTVGMTVSGTTLGSSITSTDTGTGTINDDDSAAVTINDANADEGDGITFTVTLSEAVQDGLTVTPSFTDVSAVEGTDYDENTTALSFTGTKGETKTFTVDTTEDTVVEANETFTVSLTASDAPTGTTVTATDTGTGTINNDDGAVVTVNDANADEGDGITFTVTLGAAVQGGLTVTPSFTDVSAVEGTDYDENTTALSFTGTKGETKTFIVSTTEDAVLEADETFTVGLSVSNSGVTSTDTGTGTINNDDSAAVTINDANADEGDGITFTVTLSEAVQGGLTVTPDFTDVTAVEGTDYDENTTALTFTGTKGETKTFTVDTTEDTVVEANETFTVSLAVSDAPTGTTVTATDTGTGTINNDDSAEVTVNDASAAEGSDITFTVTLDAAVQGGLTVTPDFTDVTAVEGTDYDENTTALSFTGTANETKTFTVSTTQDTVVESNETFTVGLTVSGAPKGVTATDTGTGTINSANESKADTATLTIDDASASEGNSMTFTVTLSEAVQGGLTVTPSYTNGTAASGDYTANTTALSFTGTKGETKTFTVSTTEDAVLEGNETFTVGLTVSGTTLSDSITSTDTGTGTINNDDSAAVTVNDAEADEGDGITFTVTLGAAVQGGLKVTPSYTNGTAASGDYTANTTALSFTGTKGETKTFTVSTTEDAVLESNETFTVGLAVSDAPTGTTVTATDTGTGTIDNDDGATVTVNDAEADEGDGMTFTVTLGAAVQGGLKVTPGYTNGTAASTDYTANTTALTFTGTANETKTFTVSTTEDAVLEADETFTVGLSVSGTSLTITATDTGTGTINNDDSAAVTIDDANADEGNGMTFTVTLGAAVQGGLTVTPGYTNGTAASTDYTANTTALTFNGTKGETKTFTVQTTEDAVLESDETFTVDLTVSGTSLDVTDDDTATGTITDDDGAKVTIADANAGEGDSMTFTVTLGAAVQGGLTVTPSFTDVTAVEGTDYDENTTALSFTGTANETKTFTVSTTEDDVLEANETFTVGLTVSGTTLDVTDDDTGTGTINNDDSATVTVNDADADEGDSMTFTVTLDKAVQGGLTVTPGFTDDTATEGTDYTKNTTALRFTGTANETKTFTVSTTQDTILEADETFTVGLSVSKAPAGVTYTDTGTGTVNNDDGAGVIVNDANAAEGQSMTFTVTLTDAVQGGLTVTPGFTNGTASGTDYAENTAPLNFSGTANETKSFTVSTTEDTVVEGDETFTVGLTVSGTSLSVDATDTGTGTINDNDGAVVTVNNAEASEGDDMTFTVTLGEAVQDGLTVTPSFTDVTAVEGTDYDENTTALSFSGTKGETKTFTVSTTEDAVLEANETFTVGLSVSNSSVTATDTGTGTINNDDSAVVTVNNADADEGDAMTFTVTLDTAVQGGLTVTPSFTDVTAVEGTDYDENATALSFTGTANETQTFTVSTTQDSVVEGNETFTVGLTVSGTTLTGNITSTDTSTGTINDDDNAPSVDLSVNPATVAEDAGATPVTVTATFSAAVTYPTDTPVTVSVGDSADSAVSGTDYAAVTDFTVTIPAGASSGSGTFTLTPTHDTLVEGDETISVDGAATGLTVNGTSLTLTDNDSVTAANLVVNLSVNPATVAEDAGATAVTVTATFSNAVTYTTYTPVTVSVGDSADSATSGTDYADVADFTVTIPAGASSGTGIFTLTPTDDTLVEGNETITVSGTATGLTVNGTSLTLTDDDGDPVINLSVNPATVAEDAGATAVTVTATFSNAVTYTTDTPVTVSVGDSTDSAVSGTDYAAVTDFTVTIPAGASSGTGIFTLTPTDDTLVEGDETISVDGAATGLTVNGTSLALSDDDGDPVINLSVNPATVAEDAGATAVTVTATFSPATTYDTDTPVTVSVGDSTDSATSGTDYAAVANFTVTIAAGQTSGSASFTLTPTDDTLVEGDETISVDGAATGLTVNGTSLILTDDDGDPVINLSVNPATVAEDAGATAVTVTAAFSPATTYDTDTPVTVSVGDSTDSATSGTDYAAVANFTVTIAAGQTSGSASFTLTPTDDTLVEGDETISVDGAATGLTVNGTSLILTDDDGDPVINLSVNPATVAEDAGATAVTVTAAFSPATTYDTDTPVTVSVGDSADSATSGTDYAAVANFTVTIAAGQTSGSASFTLTPTDDTLVEGDETISVDGAATGRTVNGTSLALSDDDDFATVTVSNARALEGETMTFTLTLDKTAPGNFTVTPVYSDGTATAKVDYTPNTSSVAFAGQAGEQHTFTVATLADDLVEPDETFGVSLGIVGPSGIRGRSGSGTIDSNDVVTVVAAIPQGDDVREAGGPRVMTARVWANGLTFSTDMAFTVQVGNGSGTAQEGVDYETVPDFDVVIPAGATSAAQDFTVTPIDDRIVEGDETIVLDGTLPGYDVAPSTLTILDDDAPDFSLAVTPARVRESDGPTPVTVTVETGGVTFPADVNVAVEVTDGTAIAGEDYARVAAFDLLIAAGETSGTGTFTLIPTADGVKEDDEDVRVAGVVRGRTVGDLPDGYDLAPESVVLADDTVVPNRLDAVNREVLPHVARAMLASNIAALTECGVSGTAPGSSLASLLGTHGQALETGDLSLQQALGDADFRVPLRASQEEEASARFKLNALWGCGDYRMLSDRSDDALDWEGNLFSLHLGVDAQVLPNLVTGLALSRSQARFDYRDLSAAGQHRTDVTSVSPYARWTLAQGMSLWAMAGLGWGSVEIDDDALAAGSSDAGLTLAALGLDNALLTRLHGSGETSLRLKAEGSLGRLSVDGSDTLGALAVQVQRLRLALEGSRTWQMQSGGAWTTALEVGLRHDGGDGATGSGVEVGGGVNYHDARLGLTLALSGRTLVAHGADYDEWGVGGMIRFDPGRQGVGLSASLQPVLGQAQSGVAQLWEQTLVDPSSALGGEAARVEAELGYGLVALGGRGLVRPYTQVSMAGEGSRHYRMGSRLELGDTLRVGVEVGRREASGSETDHGVMLRLELGSAGGGVAVGSGLHGGGLPNAGPVDGRLGRFSSRAWDAGRE